MTASEPPRPGTGRWVPAGGSRARDGDHERHVSEWARLFRTEPGER